MLPPGPSDWFAGVSATDSWHSLCSVFFCPSCHMRPSIDSWPASSHTLPPMNRRYAPPLQRSGVTLLRPPGVSAPDPRESSGTSAPAVAGAGSAIGSEAARREREKAHWHQRKLSMRAVWRSYRHSQRTVLSALWLCVLQTCDDVNYCSQHVCTEPALVSSHFSVSVVIKNAPLFLKAPRSIVFETFDWMHGVPMQQWRKPTPTVRARRRMLVKFTISTSSRRRTRQMLIPKIDE